MQKIATSSKLRTSYQVHDYLKSRMPDIVPRQEIIKAFPNAIPAINMVLRRLCKLGACVRVELPNQRTGYQMIDSTKYARKEVDLIEYLGMPRQLKQIVHTFGVSEGAIEQRLFRLMQMRQVQHFKAFGKTWYQTLGVSP